MKLQAFTSNRKTLLSIDFDRTNTCPQICSYCYVENTERIYKAYATKIKKNYTWALNDSVDFSNTLNKEYWQLRNSKTEKLKKLKTIPIRIYGSGDYIPGHFKFIEKLNFPFFIISKSLTLKTMASQLKDLLNLDNTTSIVLSFDKDNIKNYANVKHLFNTDKIKFSYTGLPEEFTNIKANYKFNIFFNISDKKAQKLLSRQFVEQCPCDSGVLSSEGACTNCNKCWRSSKTKNRNFFKDFSKILV